jgi:hypothetical protein
MLQHPYAMTLGGQLSNSCMSAATSAVPHCGRADSAKAKHAARQWFDTGHQNPSFLFTHQHRRHTGPKPAHAAYTPFKVLPLPVTFW